MIGKLREGWAWFVDGLVDAVLWAVDRAGRAVPHRLVIGEADAAVLGPDGNRLGRLWMEGGTARFEPAELGRRLGGAALDLAIPSAWQLRRDLDPVAIESRPFLDAFVRHQIERITPWRVADTYYRILQSPLAGDAGRLAISVAVVPKRLVAPWIGPLDALRPRSIRLLTADGSDPVGAAIPLAQDHPRLAAPLRRAVVACILVLGFGTAATVGWLQWEAGSVRDDNDDQDRVLAERKAVAARAQQHDHAGGDVAAKIKALRDGRPRAVAIIDALAAAVPDSAHLTSLSIEKDHVVIVGVSTDPSRLVPSLEQSGSFASVAFGAATTRVESGAGDRFSLEMKAVDRKAGGPTDRAPVVGLSPQARATP